MENEVISVIVPCYNLEDYTRRCLESILCQTYHFLEVIVVDDGSTDATPKIIKEYADKDSRIVFVQQKNQGAGMAINHALSIAKGKYIAFVDNDDWIEKDMYARLYEALTKNQADMAVCNYNLVYTDHVEFCYSKMKTETVSVYDDVYSYFSRYCTCAKPNNYTWTRLYRADIIRNSNVRFESFPLGSDTLFNFKLLPLVRKVAFVPDGLYNYVQRENSSVYTAAKRYNLATVYADCFESLAKYYQENKYEDFFCVLPIYAFSRVRSIFFYSRLAGISDEEITQNIMSAFKGRLIVDCLTGARK